jgi:hypothetical protein
MVRLPALHHHYFYRDSAVVTFPKASRLDRRATRIVGQNKAGRGALHQTWEVVQTSPAGQSVSFSGSPFGEGRG